MSRKLWLCAVVLLLVAVVPSSVSQLGPAPIVWPERQGLIVMTFNIRTSMANDGFNSWLFRQTMVADVIRSEAPDLVMVQEANPIQIGYLKSQLPGYRVATSGIGSQWFGYPVILFREDRFKVQTTERLWFSFAPEIAESTSWGNKTPRCVTAVKLFDNFRDRTFVVGSTHLDHRSSESRIESIQMLADWARTNTETLVILGGDFNEPADSSVLNVLRGSSGPLEDSFVPELNSIGTIHGFAGAKGPRIDMILTSSEWKVGESQILSYNRSGRYPSDHYPVVATLEYPDPPLLLVER